MKKELMLDLETLSTASNAAVISIGIILMDMDELKICAGSHWNIQFESVQELGLHIDARSIAWWLSQGEEAKASLWSPTPVPFADAVMELTAMYYPDDSYPTWGNGAAFDNVIFRNACEKANVPCPYVFYHDRCYRTMKTLFPNVPQPPRAESEKHNALKDAKHQAEHLLAIMRHIRGQNESVHQDRV